MTELYTQRDGQRLFREDRALALTDPRFRAIYEEEATQKELWLQLVEARKTTGLTQEQVAGRMGHLPGASGSHRKARLRQLHPANAAALSGRAGQSLFAQDRGRRRTVRLT